MRRRSLLRHAVVWVVAALVAAGAWIVPDGVSAGAATAQGALTGEGGDALGPVIQKLLRDDTAGLAPDTATYTNVDLDQGIADFVGTAPNTFGNDFAVTERPLTTAEAATAKANGRSYAYVPFAATPVALVTLVPNSNYTGSLAINFRLISASTSRLPSTSWTVSTGPSPLRIRAGATADSAALPRRTRPPTHWLSFARAISTQPWRTKT